MIELRRDPDLLQKSVSADVLANLGSKHLDRDRASVLEILRKQHDRHAASAQFALDAVTIGERTVQAAEGIGHVR
jgi:hypothetical protein